MLLPNNVPLSHIIFHEILKKVKKNCGPMGKPPRPSVPPVGFAGRAPRDHEASPRAKRATRRKACRLSVLLAAWSADMGSSSCPRFIVYSGFYLAQDLTQIAKGKAVIFVNTLVWPFDLYYIYCQINR
ncbi:MAG: hypothetical protein IJJ33_20160 [Victivallales bacterium]|nr:hypothetical protein [Victivallales bacterium]